MDRVLAAPAAEVRRIGPGRAGAYWIRLLGGPADTDAVTTLANTLTFLGIRSPSDDPT